MTVRRDGSKGVRGPRRMSTIVALALALALGGGVATGAEPRIDLNQASLEQLTTLPGIGPARARAIIEWREDAPFETTDDLSEVPGIGDGLADNLRARVEVGDPGRQVKRAGGKR